MFQLVEFDVLASDQVKDSTGSSYDDVRRALLEHLDVFLLGNASIDHLGLEPIEVFLESVEFLLDLESQFSGVCEHDCTD